MKYLVLPFFIFSLLFFTPAHTETVSEDIDDAIVQKILDSGDTAALQKLIDAGLDVNSRDADGNTILFYMLTHYSSLDMAKTLINAGADVNLPSANGLTPLLVATALASELQLSQQPVTAENNLNAEIQQANFNEQQKFLLKRSQELLQLLIANGADVNQETPRGTPLMSAATSDLNAPLVKTLLKADANVNQQDRFGRTALFYAAAFGCDTISTMLLKAGADIRIKDNDGHGYMELEKQDIINSYE
ncbi:MAG: ankyrin repeat domain-containing protein [Alphaproteobacteria bacterium]|nr:ankyrin repeat domain-containing protein [Alphaproteobacteria bacterium]